MDAPMLKCLQPNWRKAMGKGALLSHEVVHSEKYKQQSDARSVSTQALFSSAVVISTCGHEPRTAIDLSLCLSCPTRSRRRSLKGESGKCYCNQPQFTPFFEGKTHCLSTSQVSSLPGTGCVGNTNNSNQTETTSLNNYLCGGWKDFTAHHKETHFFFFPWNFYSFSPFLGKKASSKNPRVGTTGTPLCQLLLHTQEHSSSFFQLPKRAG